MVPTVFEETLAARAEFMAGNRYWELEPYFDVDAAFRILSKSDFGFVHQILSFSRYQPGAIMDTASHLHTWEVMHFVLVHDYGRDYLSHQEFTSRHTKVQNELYLKLGEAWLKDRVRQTKVELWEFQRKQLRSVGEDVRPDLLAKGALNAAVTFLSNPGFLLGDIWRALRPPKPSW